MVQIDPRYQRVMDKYGAKLGSQYQSAMDQPSRNTFTMDYDTFRKEALRLENSLYERACNFAHSIIDLAPSKQEQKDKLQEAIDTLHLNITPAAAYTLAILTMGSFFLLAILIFIISLLFGSAQILVPLLIIMMGVGLLFPLSKWPIHLAQRRRLKASNQMVLTILYVVIYMRHTSNLEHAIKFAGEHIGHPLALDLRKILWNVETDANHD